MENGKHMSDTNPSSAVHPTVFLVLWFAVGFGLEWLWPLPLPELAFLEPLKIGLLLAGGGLFGWSALALRRHDTTMEHREPTTELVTGGPYGVSRNPMYLALVLILLGMAIQAGSLWFVLVTALFWAALQWLTVSREEAYLSREFGYEYARYRSSVRQWI